MKFSYPFSGTKIKTDFPHIFEYNYWYLGMALLTLGLFGLAFYRTYINYTKKLKAAGAEGVFLPSREKEPPEAGVEKSDSESPPPHQAESDGSEQSGQPSPR